MIFDDVIEKISEQQKGKEGTAVYGCGEQLKDICRKYPHAAELVLQDLEEFAKEWSEQISASVDEKLKGGKTPKGGGGEDPVDPFLAGLGV